MYTHNSNFLSFLSRTSVFGALLLIVSGTFYFFNVSAKTEAVEKKPAEQDLVNGRLAFETIIGTFSGPQFAISTANADGTGQVGVTSFPPATDPTWSPDGTKIAYASGNTDIQVINTDGTNSINITNTQSAIERNPSWSVTSRIAYERDNEIWIMNADGTNQMPFPGITQPSAQAPAWSADGGKIAFTSGDEIWTIRADGTNERRVTTNTTTDAAPSWSPDGTKIVFAKVASGIAVVDADGTNEMNLTNNASDVEPAWSPDGTTIAFRRGSPDGGIYLMNASGANQVRIIADTPGTRGSTHGDPAWQPVAQVPNTFSINGRISHSGVTLSGVIVNLSGTINAVATTDAVGNYQFSGLPAGGSYTISPSLPGYYFTPPNLSFNNLTSNQTANFTAVGVCQGANCARNGKIAFVRSGEIFTMNSDGADQINITNNAANDGEPNYSPDGANIIFTSNRDGNNEIYRMNADGSNPVRLTNNPASDSQPSYSPDGASIVFSSDRDGNLEIYKMNADGSNQVRLTNDAAHQISPAFSPDGQKIIFVNAPAMSPRQLFTMNADGSNPQQIPGTAGPGGFYNRPSYSPDGSKIIFVYGDDVTTQTIWTMNADGTNRAQFPAGRSSPTYSPDGTKVSHVCCFTTGPFSQNGIYVTNSNGSSPQRITTGMFDDFPDWQPLLAARRTTFDFDGDGRSDVSVFRPSNGTWYQLRSEAGFSAVQWGIANDVLVPGDYDGDLKTDVAVWRPSNGNFYILNSFNNTFRGENFGLEGDVPVGGDWDGDGKADPAVYRPGAQGAFYYRSSMGNPQGNINAIPWGTNGDKPVAGDYDGDGKYDAAVFRNGTWYIRQSSNGQFSVINFGLADDRLIPADYDADGKIDPAVYRGGNWYLLRSTQGFTAFQFGSPNDTPAPADYDGDGRADAAIFREGVWWILKTQSGATEAVSFGFGSDAPVASAFVR